MIKINKPLQPPEILKNNAQTWTKNLEQAISEYGSYSEIPNNKKDGLLKFYRHPDIKDALSRSSHGKCAFCECIPSESGYLEVEHFAPKSLYPDLTFNWDNLLPICRKCNGSKSNHNTLTYPILNPANEDVENFLDFNVIDLIPKQGTKFYEKAKLTINICDLNRTTLLVARSDVLVELVKLNSALSNYLEKIKTTSTDRVKQNKIRKLKNSIDSIEFLKAKDQKYSLFCKIYLEQHCPGYLKAKNFLASLNDNYD